MTKSIKAALLAEGLRSKPSIDFDSVATIDPKSEPVFEDVVERYDDTPPPLYYKTRTIVQSLLSMIISGFTPEDFDSENLFIPVCDGYIYDDPEAFCFSIAPCTSEDFEAYKKELEAMSEDQLEETLPPLDFDVQDAIERFLLIFNEQNLNGKISSWKDDDGYYYIETDDPIYLVGILEECVRACGFVTKDALVKSEEKIIKDKKAGIEFVGKVTAHLDPEYHDPNDVLLLNMPSEPFADITTARVNAAYQLALSIKAIEDAPPLFPVSFYGLICDIAVDMKRPKMPLNHGLYLEH